MNPAAARASPYQPGCRLSLHPEWRRRPAQAFSRRHRCPARRSLLPRPTAEPAEAAAEVEDGEAVQVRQQGTQIRPFRSPVQALDRTREPTVPPEELLIVVDVLRHSAYLDI